MANDAPRGLIPLLSACNFVIGMGAFVVIGMITPVSLDLGISTATAGYMLTAYALAYAVLSPVLVSATGRLGRRRVLALGLALFAFGMALSAASSSLVTLFVGRMIAAAGAGMFTPVAAVVAAGLSAPESRGRALAAVFFGLTLAQVLGVPTGSWVAYTFGWRIAFWLVLMLAMVGLWLVWTRVPAGLSFQPVSLEDLGRTMVNGPVIIAVLFTASFLAAIYILYTYLSPLMETTMGFGRDGVTLVLLVYGLGAVGGNLVGGWLADRTGPVKALVLVCLCQILLMPIFSGLPLPVWLLLILVLLWAATGWGFMAAQQLRLLSLAPEAASVVLALNAAAIYVGAAVGSAIGSQVVDGVGLGLLGAAGGIGAMGALLHILGSHRQVMARRA